MPLVITIIILFILLILSSIKIVEQNTVLVLEFLGKFNRTMTAGLNFKIPFLERIAEKVTLRQQNFALKGLSNAGNNKVIFFDTSINKTNELTQQMLVALEGSKDK